MCAVIGRTEPAQPGPNVGDTSLSFTSLLQECMSMPSMKKHKCKGPPLVLAGKKSEDSKRNERRMASVSQ